MPIPIVATKLHAPPRRPDAVARPHLVAQVEDGADRKLTLVSAPAGFGKTTLVREWMDASERPTAWLSLDAEDSDLLRFLSYLAATLQSLHLDAAGAPLGERTAGRLASEMPDPSAALAALVNEAAEAPPFALVLDDYHALDAPPVDEALAFLVEHLPAHAQLIVTSREDPPLPLARLRARGHLAEVRAADLRFSTEEASTFLLGAMGLDLAPDDIAALGERTEGWAAGLQLAALSLQGREDASGFVASFTGSHRFVVDYLAEEVLSQQPEATRDFLLCTSILDRLSGPLCDAILARPKAASQADLDALARANLFLVPLDDERRWFRYHHLFRDLLRQRLPQAMADDLTVDALHRRASAWFEAEGQEAEAARHALATEDSTFAADTIERTWDSMHRQHRDAEWLTWARQLPEADARSRPTLARGIAWALLNAGQLEAAEDWLRISESDDFMPDPSEASSGAAACAFLAAARGDVEETVIQARRALEVVPPGARFERGRASTLLGLALWAQGELDEAYTTFASGMADIRAQGDIQIAVSGAYALAEIQRAQGRLRAAIATYEGALREATTTGNEPFPAAAVLHAGLARVLCEQGEVEAAAHHLARSETVAEQTTVPPPGTWRVAWNLAQSRLLAARGDLDGALALLDHVEEYGARVPLPNTEPVAAMRARLWLRAGRQSDAETWARGVQEPEAMVYLREYETTTRARVLLAGGQADEARDLATRVLDSAETENRATQVLDALVVLALAEHALGDEDAATDALRRAVALAKPESVVQVFADEGTPLLDLLRLADEAPARRLLAALGDDTPDSVGPLTARESEVLALVASGLRNREVADRLFISLPTVKRHLANAYGKLDVRNRVEAIARARELGLAEAHVG